jgi:hypothetical protein
MAIKTFTTGEVLTASDTNTYLANSGLVYVTSTSVGTGTTLTISNVFTSTYDNYRIIFSGLRVGSGTIFITTQLRAASTTTTTGYYDSRLEVDLAGVLVGAGNTNGGTWNTCIVGDATRSSGASFDLFNPNNAAETSYNGAGLDARTTGAPYRAGGGFQNSTTQFDGIVFTATNNFAAGTVAVYGYRKA